MALIKPHPKQKPENSPLRLSTTPAGELYSTRSSGDERLSRGKLLLHKPVESLRPKMNPSYMTTMSLVARNQMRNLIPRPEANPFSLARDFWAQDNPRIRHCQSPSSPLVEGVNITHGLHRIDCLTQAAHTMNRELAK
jgi:hypothetical protein